ncbi:MAG: response regulator transcription factor [Vampirovibrionales bacterium]|nr:response regulator transcription factor [Vampirovibrionales bacterium]
MKALIAEDHELVRYGLVMALEESPGVEIVGEAENGRDALRLTDDLQPDIILMDIGMPVMDGITATHLIKRKYPNIKIVMLTSHKDEEEVFASLAAGADAYCMKDIKVERLCQILAMVQEGAVWLDPAIASLVLAAIPSGRQAVAAADVARPSAPASGAMGAGAPRKRYNADLTEREIEVLQLIVEGKSNKEIAQALEVTTHTAKAHVGNIIQKLAVDDRTQAAVKAIKEGYC